MESTDAIDALAALAQPTRLAAFRALIAAEPDGLGAGQLARKLGVPANTLSNHMGVLTRARLAAGGRSSRNVIYRANPARVHELAGFLTRDCCGGRPQLCADVSAKCSTETIDA